MPQDKNSTSSLNSGSSAGPLLQDPALDLNRALHAERIEVLAPVSAEMAEILTPEALRFVAKLSRRFSATREALLQKRVQRQAEIDAGKMPDFLPETEEVRKSKWTVDPAPKDLQDRRVEITGPVDRKMVINALNSGASVYMADFEDANTPTWSNLIEGHVRPIGRWLIWITLST